VLWSGLVSWVGASHRVNVIAPFPLGQKCPRKITINYKPLLEFTSAQTKQNTQTNQNVGNAIPKHGLFLFLQFSVIYMGEVWILLLKILQGK